MKIRKILQNNKSLLGYIVFTYIDKALYFLLPMLVLYIAKDEVAYNTVEYVCSIGNIVVPFLTFVSTYAFYGYKIAEDKGKFINLYSSYASISTIVIGIGTLIVTHALRYIGIKGIESLELYIAIRTMFYIFVQCINSYYRLIDKPIKSLLYSILINCASAVSMLVLLALKSPNIVDAFFIPELLAGVMAVSFIINAKDKIILREYIIYLKSAILFAWPIVLNSTAVAFVANYGKVYAYNFLSSYEMYTFSFVLRIAMILQMAHQSVISFFSKDIYINGYSRKFIVSYVAIMLSSLIGTFAVLIIYNQYFAKQVIPIDLATCLVLLYTILHMFGAVLEVDFGRNNKNKFIFIMSSIACFVYILLIFALGVRTTVDLALYMVIYMILYVCLLGLTWRKVLRK